MISDTEQIATGILFVVGLALGILTTFTLLFDTLNPSVTVGFVLKLPVILILSIITGTIWSFLLAVIVQGIINRVVGLNDWIYRLRRNHL